MIDLQHVTVATSACRASCAVVSEDFVAKLAVVATVTCYRLTTLIPNATVDLTRNIICRFSAMFAMFLSRATL